MLASKPYSQFGSALPATNEQKDGSLTSYPDGIDSAFRFSEKTIRMAFIRWMHKLFIKNVQKILIECGWY